jgi:hypothetical protein
MPRPFGSLNKSRPKKMTPDISLLYACRDNDLEKVRVLIRNYAVDINRAFLFSCQLGHIDIVKLLIEKGANDLNNGLIYALYGRHYDLAYMLYFMNKDPEYDFRNENFNKYLKNMLVKNSAYFYKALKKNSKDGHAEIHLTNMLNDFIRHH